MFKSQKPAEDEDAKLAWMIKCVEETLADREAEVSRREKDVAAKYARLNESLNFVVAVLTDAGRSKIAEFLIAKVKGTWSGGDQ
jgi:hypothetical protein